MKNKRFVHSWVLLALLVASVALISFGSNLKFTGYSVLSEYPNQVACESNNYSWYNDVCNSEPAPVCDATHLDLCLDEATCTTATGYWYNSLCNSATQTCTESWTYSDWGACTSGTQTRTATTDANDCVATCTGTCTITHTETLSQTCTCSENWECTDWGECSSGTKTRTCSDLNACETTTNQPSLTHDCEVSTESSLTTSAVEEVIVPTCTTNWQCGDWQECVESSQVRICTDLNECNDPSSSPATSQACVVEVTETCSDKIKNQDETGVDCGGSTCKKCSIFSIVGSAITNPIEIGKNFVLEGMFKTTLSTIISIAVMVTLVGGLVFLKVFLKKRKKLKD